MLSYQDGGRQIDFIIIGMLSEEPPSNELEMSINTFTHDFYILELPPLQKQSFYKSFPLYLNKIDYKGNHIKAAPVVRIYGTNEYGEKCCCHIHGFFPFLYIKAEQYEDIFRDEVTRIDFVLKLEAVFKEAFKIDKAVIYQAQLEYKYDLYGYHTEKEAFLKLHLYDPQQVLRVRELLSCQVLGKKFQCYEAHINYYMQFFSEFNVYGINEMKICGFTFRKNLHIMPLFEKLSSRVTTGMAERGCQLQQLCQKRPECFNPLYRTSTCYIEVDIDCQAILNAYQNQESDTEDVCSSDEELLQKAKGSRILKVQVTKALKEVWRDQKKRRSRFNIRKSLGGVIDVSRNIEGTEEVEMGRKDPLWSNFILKGENGQQLLRMLRSYKEASAPRMAKQVNINAQLCQNYKQAMTHQRESLIKKVQGRWHYYAQRTSKIINQLMTGQRSQLPEWSDEENEPESESENSEDSKGSQMSEEPQNSSLMSKTQKVGNTAKYRNNFKFQAGEFNSKSIFSDCNYCRKKVYCCNCVLCPICSEEDCTCDMTSLNIEQQISQMTNENVETACYEYSIEPPSYEQVSEQVDVQVEHPFYSKIKDLFVHYKIGKSFPECSKIGQYLDRQVKNTNVFNRIPTTIPNHKKLPYFYDITELKPEKKLTPKTIELEYQPLPPEIQDVVPQMSQKKDPRASSTHKIEDSFVSDLVICTYELLPAVNDGVYLGDPQKHQLAAIVFELYNEQTPAQSSKGVIMQDNFCVTASAQDFDEYFLVKDERSVLSMFINIVFRADVDVFLSWDMEKRGIRYLACRGIANGINVQACLSRVCDLEEIFQHINFTGYTVVRQTHLRRELITKGNVEEMAVQRPSRQSQHYLQILRQKINKRLDKKPVLRQKYLFDVEIKGRVNVNLNRVVEQVMKIRSYTLEAVVKIVFDRQLPEFTDRTLTQTLQVGKISAALNHVKQRVQFIKLLVHELHVLSGVVEKSKVYGADFLSMMERGSQFKIESVLCRTAKQHNFLTLSATKAQVAEQSVLQCRPLVLQPPKQFFSDPVLLFDFQSLYPSVMIAYNLCYSTCLGSIRNLFSSGKYKVLGVSKSISMNLERLCDALDTGRSDEQIIRLLGNNIFITPNKVAFVKKTIRQGFIPKILLEFLISRIMIKKSTNLYKKDSIKGILKQRQMALKLFMNVMFGYTGASFTGRMPCSEMADSVVELAKYSLRKSIDFLNEHTKYKGQVLYGDTDSIFFKLPGYTIPECIEIGNTLAGQMTKLFPYPMEMKFEKVYESLFLVSKKRYYGKYYESADGGPKYEGKGLQTVRRDGIPYTSKVMTDMLNQLIDTKDLSRLKEHFFNESRNLLEGTVSLGQLCLAKQVKLLKYSQRHCPAHGQAAKRLEPVDPMLVPKYGERLKYIIAEGGQALKQRAVALFEYMLHPQRYSPDYNYYYKKQFVPPLRRVLLSLVNIDEWGNLNQYNDKKEVQGHQHSLEKGELVCIQCLEEALFEIEKQFEASHKTCNRCISEDALSPQQCIQWNCPNLYIRQVAEQDWKTAKPRGQALKQAKRSLGC